MAMMPQNVLIIIWMVWFGFMLYPCLANTASDQPTTRPTRSPSSRFWSAAQGANSFTYSGYSYSAGMAIGYDEKNKTALFIGGFSDWQYQYSTFKPSDDLVYGTFYGKSRTYLQQYSNAKEQMMTYGSAQYYTTLGDTMWTVTAGTYGGTGLNKFDLKTQKAEHTSINIPQSIGTSGQACSASHSHYLFVIGGWPDDTIKWLNTVQIYDNEADKWLNDVIDVPSLNKTRNNLACVTIGDKLYAIAGNGHDGYLRSIEVLNIGDDLKWIQSQHWQMMNAQIKTALGGLRAVTYGEYIITAGGMATSKVVSSDINVINTQTETV
eukprot:691549_1